MLGTRSVNDGPTVAITRRRLLQVSAAAGLSAFLAACGTAGTGPPAPRRAAAATGRRAERPGSHGHTRSDRHRSASATRRTARRADRRPPRSAQALGTPAARARSRWPAGSATSTSAQGQESIRRSSGSRRRPASRSTTRRRSTTTRTSSLRSSRARCNGRPTGWDVVVLTDWMIVRLINLGWLETIDPPSREFPANLAISTRRAIGTRGTSTPRRGSRA